MKKEYSIQEYLSLGYIYLLALGILSDSIYYQFLGINILEYSSVLDVLISPIALLTKNLLIPFTLIFFVGIGYLFIVHINPWLHRKLRPKPWYRRMYNVEKLDAKYSQSPSTNKLLTILAGLILSFYLGIGLGGGSKQRSLIQKKAIEPDYRIRFQDDNEERVKLLGKNSLYLFYVPEGQTDIIISPIEHNVKKIITLEEEK